MAQVSQLMRLPGIGPVSSWTFVMEFFGWRRFQNPREVAALAGLTPTPYDSGKRLREQGISKAGNRRVRTLAIEIAWAWLRYQPRSKLSRWFLERGSRAGSFFPRRLEAVPGKTFLTSRGNRGTSFYCLYQFYGFPATTPSTVPLSVETTIEVLKPCWIKN